jgi:hypothetical protein
MVESPAVAASGIDVHSGRDAIFAQRIIVIYAVLDGFLTDSDKGGGE